MSKTHWKKLHNPDYIGAYALEPGKDLILTIKLVKNEVVIGSDGKKEECMIMRFAEPDIKPMIVNSTNAKTIEKLYNTPYIEDWAGRKIQLYSKKIKAFGETVDALRIRDFIPKQTEKLPTKCFDCGNNIKSFGNTTAEQLATYTYQKYGKSVCSECATKLKERADANKVVDPLAGGPDVD